MSFCPPYLKLLAVLSLAGSLGVQRAVAQISAANDGTGTQVNQNGNTTNILGGTTSGNNLFHSFWDFNVGTGQIANFWSLPDIQNILARVTGGNTSTIDGLMQVTGSNANLFLLNPAGIIFGAGASLNVPGSFMATTATGIGFGNAWFSATGSNDYGLLTGNPTSLAFTGSQVGGIVNQGNLSTPGGTLSLVAGGIYSPGTLGGQGVTVSTVGSGSFVRLNQPGQLLSLMVPVSQPNTWNHSIQSLPQLLTGGNVQTASTMTPGADGSVVIGGSGLVLRDQDIVLGEVNSGKLALEGNNITFTDINKAENILLNASGFVMGNSITTAPISGNTNAFNINVTADGSVNIQTINASGNLQGNLPGNPIGNGGNVSIQSTGGDIQLGSIATDGGLLGGNINLTADAGSITVGSIDTRAYGQGGQGGSVNVNATVNVTFTGTITTGATNLDSQAGTVFLCAKDGFVQVKDIFTDANLANAGSIQLIALGGSIAAGNLSATSGGGNGGSVNLSAAQNLQTGALTTVASGVNREGGAITLSGTTITGLGDLSSGNTGSAGNAGFISIVSDGAIQLNNLFANSSIGLAGSVNIESTTGSVHVGTISATGLGFEFTEPDLNCAGCLSEFPGVSIQALTDITTGNINTSNPSLGAANGINLSSLEGNVTTGNLQATGQTGDGGSIFISGETVTTGDISTFSLNNGNGGLVSIAANANLNINNVNTYANTAGFQGGLVFVGAGGNISINGDIVTGNINTAGIGGSVSLVTGGNITTHNIYTDSSIDQAGLVSFNAGGTITAQTISATSNIEQFDEGARVQLSSQGNLTLGNINTSGFINGGSISLTSLSGDINTTGGAITAVGSQGDSGAVSIFADQGNISTGLIDTSNLNFGNGGSVYLEASTGQVTLGPINSFANGTGLQGGTISVIAGTNIITLGDVVAGNANPEVVAFNANAGNIEFTANGFIDTTASGLFAASNLGDGGTISLSAGDYIRTGDMATGSLGSGSGGTISLSASNAVSTEGLVALGSGSTTGGGLFSITNTGPILINDLVSLGAAVFFSGASSITINGDWNLTGPSFTVFNFGVNSGGGDFTVNGNVLTNGGSFEVVNAGNLTVGASGSLLTGGGQINLAGNQVNISGLLNSGGGNLNLAGNAGLSIGGSLQSSGGMIGLASTNGTIQIDGVVDSSNGAVNILDFNNSFLLNGIINTGDATFSITGNSQINVGGSINAGAINLDAAQILASGNIAGTTLNFNANMIDTSSGYLSSIGLIELTASGDLATGLILSNGGAINLTGNTINTTANFISSTGTSGSGNVNLNSNGDINAGLIFTDAATDTLNDSGNITLISTAGNITTAQLSTASASGGGNVTLSAFKNIQTDSIFANTQVVNGFFTLNGSGGTINLTSQTGTIDTSRGFLITSGGVTISTPKDIYTGVIQSGKDITLGGLNGGFAQSINTTALLGENTITFLGATGAISLKAQNLIKTWDVFASSISIQGGDIDTTLGNLFGSLAGPITLTATNSIKTGDITNNSGDIILTGNSLDTQLGTLNAGGLVKFTSNSTILSGAINANQIQMQGASINTTAGSLFGAGGVTLITGGDLNTANITTNGSLISLTGNRIDTRFGTLDSRGFAGGNIELTAISSIYTGDVIADSFSTNAGATTDATGHAGNITLAATTGSIEANGTLSAQGQNQAGAITLTAGGDITTRSITNTSTGTGADISLTSQTGTIDTSSGFIQSSKNIIVRTPSDIFVGEVYAEGDITLGGLNGGAARSIIARSSYSNYYDGSNTYYYDSSSIFAKGSVTLTALNTIDTDHIFGSSITLTGSALTTGILTSSGGNIDLNASAGNITAQSIYASGNGTVDISALQGTVQVTGFIFETSSSILTDGGAITIAYSGLNDFTVDQTNAPLLNGTRGAISSGSNQILTGRFPDSYLQSNIQLLADGRLPVTSPTSSDPPDQPQTATNLQGITPPSLPPDQPAPSPNRVIPLLNTTSLLRDGLRFGTTEAAINQIENIQQKDLENYLGISLTKPNRISESVQETLRRLARETNRPTAIIYVVSLPQQLELILVTPEGKPFRQVIPEAKRDVLLALVREFGNEVKDPRKTNSTSYLAPAQKLYQWLIAPLQGELQARKITTIAFSMDTGLRSIPMAALHDGKKFLVEQYSLGLIPSVNLVDTRYQDPKKLEILAMGLSKAVSDQVALPAVPIEVATILKSDWQGKSFLNEDFTLDQLKSQRSAKPYGIIHLATHGEFKPGPRSNSYIQLWDNRLRLDQVRQLGWNDPPVELLVLSACRTALGDETAELGFAGFAVQAGVKTAIASLWYVSDEATLALMTNFYRQLRTAPIKAEALQQAQIAMLNGKIRVEANTVRGPASEVALPIELTNRGDRNLRHPYFWAAFTAIGSPW